eukprot:SAG11_NODE_1191_length_5572_cov_1.714364_5_plen_295_part_00
MPNGRPKLLLLAALAAEAQKAHCAHGLGCQLKPGAPAAYGPVCLAATSQAACEGLNATCIWDAPAPPPSGGCHLKPGAPAAYGPFCVATKTKARCEGLNATCVWGGSPPACIAALQSLCENTTASEAKCLMCAGAHEAELTAAGCNKSSYTSFCHAPTPGPGPGPGPSPVANKGGMHCNGNGPTEMVMRGGKFTSAKDVVLFQNFLRSLGVNTTTGCCSGNDFEASWAGDAIALFPSCPAVIGALTAKGYKGPTLKCVTAPGGMSWTKQGGAALGTTAGSRSVCETALDAIYHL